MPLIYVVFFGIYRIFIPVITTKSLNNRPIGELLVLKGFDFGKFFFLLFTFSL